jgi:hypothetical protein
MHLFLPPEGSFVCVALRDGVLPPELNVFTNIGSCIVVTRVEALRLPVELEALHKEPSWSCGPAVPRAVVAPMPKHAHWRAWVMTSS